MPLSYEDARELDAADPLAGFRGQFAIGDDPVAYLDGNSLGRHPVRPSCGCGRSWSSSGRPD